MLVKNKKRECAKHSDSPEITHHDSVRRDELIVRVKPDTGNDAYGDGVEYGDQS